MGMVGMGWWRDYGILEVFSNCNDSMKTVMISMETSNARSEKGNHHLTNHCLSFFLPFPVSPF